MSKLPPDDNCSRSHRPPDEVCSALDLGAVLLRLVVPKEPHRQDLAEFTYNLPPELIAQEPAAVRHDSRLLSVRRETCEIAHYSFSNLPELLTPGDLLIVNDTRVLPARLLARRATGGQVQILLLRPESNSPNLWRALATPLRKLKAGEVLTLEPAGSAAHAIRIHDIVLTSEGHKRLLVDLGPPEGIFGLLSGQGFAPLPPYIERNGDPDLRASDLERYQTVFARAPGAVAAPTAGLHFSQEVLDRLKHRDVEISYITLHVGPGTFKPITSTVADHTVEPELFSVPKETADAVNCAIAEKRRVIAVGTTSCRALESAGTSGRLEAIDAAETSLYIKPGYRFRVISGLITNFHLSRSSLLVLVSTFAGHNLTMRAYEEAISQRYRFYSYGDAMLIL